MNEYETMCIVKTYDAAWMSESENNMIDELHAVYVDQKCAIEELIAKVKSVEANQLLLLDLQNHISSLGYLIFL